MKLSTFFGVVCALLIVAAMLNAGIPAQAAAPTPISDNCELDSTIGVLEVYFCDSDFGPDYYVNSFGFVVVIN